MAQTGRKRAVVVGGSIGGLLAGRVLSEHFQEVILLERDRLPEGPAFRSGVPHARHAHLLLTRGWRVYEEMFPGLVSELCDGGARMIDLCRDVRWVTWSGDWVRFASDIMVLPLPRILLEDCVRKRVLALSNVHVREHVSVSNLTGSLERVTGVMLSDGEQVEADLVVDASGRRSAAPEWLEELGSELPADQVVRPHLGYATRLYEMDSTDALGWEALMVQWVPPAVTRACVFFPYQGNQWICTLIGTNGDFPPTDEAGFADFAKSIPVDDLHSAMAAARPVGDIHGFRATDNRWRRFDRLRTLPAGFLPIGDAVATFNPIYAWGMTITGLAAELLGNMLRDGEGKDDTLPRRFHRKLVPILKEAWMPATTEDLRFPGTEGERATAANIMRGYMDRLFILATRDQHVRQILFEVINMIREPTHLFKPALARAAFMRIPKEITRPQELATEAPLKN